MKYRYVFITSRCVRHLRNLNCLYKIYSIELMEKFFFFFFFLILDISIENTLNKLIYECTNKFK